MITLQINQVPYPIKTQWKDLTYSEYCDIKNPFEEKKLFERIEKLSGIPLKVIETLEVEQFAYVLNLISFMEKDIDEFQELQGKQIANEKWATLEKSKQIFQKEQNPYRAIGLVVKEYMDIDIFDKPVTEVFGYANFFLLNSIPFLSVTKG